MRNFIHKITAALAAMSVALFSGIIYLDGYLPDRYYTADTKSFSLAQSFLNTSYSGGKTSAVSQSGGTQNVSVDLLGIFPVKSVSVSQSQTPQLIASGNPFGVKMFTGGAIVVGFSDVRTDNGKVCPGKDAGLKAGDIILSVNKKEISYNEEVALIIKESKGELVLIEAERNGKTMEFTVEPVKSAEDGSYKSGIWVRDSAAGIGTITFIDPSNGVFGGLGHAICDVDTGQIMPVGSGEVCDVTINSIKKGASGSPGELLGVFTTGEAIGTIVTTNETGIYGTLFQEHFTDKTYPMAFQQEVKKGKASILGKFQGNETQEYEIEITDIDYREDHKVKNMVIKVTDPELIKLTGGIVQGMSGTPILQNGKIVGAVTHVFVNDSTKGYGIFAENMYNQTKNLES